MYHSTLGLRVIKKKKKIGGLEGHVRARPERHPHIRLQYRGTSLIRNGNPP